MAIFFKPDLIKRSLRNAPSNCTFAGEFGCNYHIVTNGSAQPDGKIAPICGAKVINIEKSAEKILPEHICKDCLNAAWNRPYGTDSYRSRRSGDLR